MKRAVFIALVLVWLGTYNYPGKEAHNPVPGMIRSLFGDISSDPGTHALRLRKICGAGLLLS